MLEARTLWELVEKRAAETPDARMVVDERGESLTFGEYRAAAERAAAGIAALGVGEGTVVSWQLPTWIESMVLVGALSRLGAIQNPILPIYREREVGFVVRQAKSRLLIVPPTFRGFDFEAMARGLAADVDGLEVLVCDRALAEGDPASLSAFRSPGGDLPARWVFYTSGTTSDPKGAQHTDASIAAAAMGTAHALTMTSEDHYALVFPLTHVGGIILLTLGLQVGSLNIIDEAFNPATTIPLLQREGVTLAGAGTVFHLAYLKAQRENSGERLFPNVRAFPGGGAPRPPQLHHDLAKEFDGAGVVSSYGMTEAPIMTFPRIDDPDAVRATTEGRPIRGMELKLITLEGKEAGPGEEGEIRAKGAVVMKGYLDSSLDADAFDEEGWFRTGDLGKRDIDGNITITGRLKDIIIRKGENISARELEEILFAHPKVGDVAVIGLPDRERGEMVCAVIEPPTDGGAISFDEMVAACEAAGLMRQKIPERLEVVDKLPRNETLNKVLKYKLREQFS